ncbi:unnamed protein product [Auanema sp. JU1783]|nr:unnamed protein product [Auanema sp. JU1783]
MSTSVEVMSTSSCPKASTNASPLASTSTSSGATNGRSTSGLGSSLPPDYATVTSLRSTHSQMTNGISVELVVAAQVFIYRSSKLHQSI